MTKYWKCPNCSRTHESSDDTKFCICKSCLIDMQINPYSFEKEVEVLGDHERNQIYSD